MPQKKSAARPAPFYRRTRTALIGLGVFAVGASAAAGLALWRRARRPSEGHAAPDLETGSHPDGSKRAPDAFRPDADAAVPESEREALRPATIPAPGLDNNVEELNGRTTH
ncbi:hypothetical protein KY084_12390 [Stakelama sp. CBK3Z-3]|uniref:Uncharacterized protein n=1 Tax=Stakelama flava TaxID=2860338 RepID=A0ABS6XN79_9SPHN|nr:hypothetical protein [Stakelama flava]MBW4331668.1 hypothetical protein [Stakelama flava]